MTAKVAALTRYAEKGKPGERLSEMRLVEGLGVEGDFHQGGEKQVSLLSAEARRWMETQPDKGLCFGRFKENILIEGLLENAALLSVGSAVLRLSVGSKRCYSECRLFSGGMHCRLSGGVVFAVVERSGIVKIKDTVTGLIE